MSVTFTGKKSLKTTIDSTVKIKGSVITVIIFANKYLIKITKRKKKKKGL